MAATEVKYDPQADAWALLALKDPANSPYKHDAVNPTHGQVGGSMALAKIRGKEFEYLVRKARTVIGRNSNTGGGVDIHLGNSSFISRAHVEVLLENGGFYLKCNGKNGIFLDGHFQRKNAPPVQMPKT
jgi:hypothetical protein